MVTGWHSTRRHLTRNDLPSDTRTTVIAMLNETLAAAIDLSLATRQAHWNLKGPQFIAVHGMMDRLRSDLDGHVDAMAERMVQLGGTACGTLQAVAQATALKPYPLDIHAVPDHLVELIERYAAVAAMVRRAIDGSAAAGDQASADVFTAASRGIDKALWFLEAHLPGEL